ncbi:MAG: DUF393 domain-containing protein [Bacteroidales bacterium]|nr:DUF393 domain-containing protein [Bacteroidales bacterium]
MNAAGFSLIQQSIPSGSGLVVFDSNCILCSKTVRFLLKTDRKKKLYFTGSNSTLFSKLKQQGIAFPQPESVVFIDHTGLYTEAEAILEILKKCGMAIPARLISYLLPEPIRKRLYRIVARNRYRWFGRSQHCFIPAPDERSRFFL